MEKLTEQILHDVIRPRPANSFKGSYGKVTLVGGNRNFGGAIIMASTAAVCAGAGLRPQLLPAIPVPSTPSYQRQCLPTSPPTSSWRTW